MREQAEFEHLDRTAESGVDGGLALDTDFTPWAWSENEAKKAKAEKVAAVR